MNKILKIILISSLVNLVILSFLLTVFNKFGWLCSDSQNKTEISIEKTTQEKSSTLADTISNNSTTNTILEKPSFFNSDRINFKTNSSTLTYNAKEELRLLAYIMKNKEKYKKMCLLIEGHTDNVGNAQKNLILSINRANAVKNILVKNGIEDWRIKTYGYGEEQPIAPNNTEKGRKANRRVDFTFKKCNQ